MLNNHFIFYPVPDMTYNVFGGTLSLTQSINLHILRKQTCLSVIGSPPANRIQTRIFSAAVGPPPSKLKVCTCRMPCGYPQAGRHTWVTKMDLPSPQLQNGSKTAPCLTRWPWYMNLIWSFWRCVCIPKMNFLCLQVTSGKLLVSFSALLNGDLLKS